jgi:DNA polymerase-3 subunit alpha
MAREIVSLQDVNKQQTRRVHFRLTTPGLDEDQLRAMREIVVRHRGECQVLVHLVIPNHSETAFRLPASLQVAASDEIMEEAERLFGTNVVRFE